MFGLFKRYRVAQLLGIPLYLDLSLLIGLGFFPVTLSSWFEGGHQEKLLLGLITYFGLLVSVTLHELGHCMAGRSCGISTESITLGFFGGVAKLEQLGSRPRDYLWVASAGPLVSLLIVLLCKLVEPLFSGQAHAFVDAIKLLNVGLLVLNLLPGFPLDGGRIFAGLCWMSNMLFGQGQRQGYARAVISAANVGLVLFPSLLVFLAVHRALSPLHLVLALILLAAGNAEKGEARILLIMDQVPMGALALGLQKTEPNHLAAEAFKRSSPESKPILAVWTEQDGVRRCYQLPVLPFPPELNEATRAAWDDGSLLIQDLPEITPAGFTPHTATLLDFSHALNDTNMAGLWIVTAGDEWIGAVRPELIKQGLTENRSTT